jgi:hypothetical protein
LITLAAQNKITVLNRKLTASGNDRIGSIHLSAKEGDGVDEKKPDIVYFRPFNFQTSDSLRRTHAIQYASHPDYPWPVLRNSFPGNYEKAISPATDPNAWFHAKIIVTYPNIKVFVNNNSAACLDVRKLNERTTGKFGLWVGNNSDGDFANLTITKL